MAEIEGSNDLRQSARRPIGRIRRILSPAFLILLVFALWISGCMEQMFYQPTRGPTPVPRGLMGAESVWFQSADGTRLHGWFIPTSRPRSNEGLPPAILHVHGNAGNIESHSWFTEFFPAAGYSVFIFDYRGYGESEGRARRRWPLIEDTNAALDALLRRNDIDANRIGMYGQSLGGAIGLNVMVDRSEIRAAIIESSFASWREIAACAVGGDDPGIVFRWLAAILIPDTHRPDEAIARIKRPILLVHGTSDSIIPVSHSRKLAAASGGRARLIELPGGDHNTLRESHPEVDQLMIDFVEKQLAASPAESKP
ncbi:MAG: alpha/beta fold hydrolase [Phycisphaerales bacterium]|nr:alpha/beta fold hydrolase [Phycisphaerales bacterium]MCI0629935.1 alpha/beta fold hydrolase [Phycisphaerales bacterium]MCI0674903.1 alpha/beta fold hydrolase [Phycisphaerales bacterium]